MGSTPNSPICKFSGKPLALLSPRFITYVYCNTAWFRLFTASQTNMRKSKEQSVITPSKQETARHTLRYGAPLVIIGTGGISWMQFEWFYDWIWSVHSLRWTTDGGQISVLSLADKPNRTIDRLTLERPKVRMTNDQNEAVVRSIHDAAKAGAASGRATRTTDTYPD